MSVGARNAAPGDALPRRLSDPSSRGRATPRSRWTWPKTNCSSAGAVQNGDYIVLTIGEPFGKAGGTNTMKIVKVGEHRQP